MGKYRKLILTFGAPLVVVLSALIDSFLVEPYWIEVTHHHLAAPLSSPLKIAHLNDIHTRGLGRREHRISQVIESERPDVIVITGDSINTTPDYSALHELLTQLHAPLGVWAVRGNHENWWPV